MSSGPTIAYPVACSTIELKDLADAIDFESNAEVGAVYAFEFTDTGHYKRKEIDDEKKPRFLKLGQIRDVNVPDPIVDDTFYMWKHQNKKWVLSPVMKKIDWEMKFEFVSPYTLVGKDDTFRKSINAKPLIVSLVPAINSRGEVAVKPFHKNNYLIHRKQSVEKDADTIVDFIPKLPIGQNATMIFDIVVRKREETTNTVLMRGINLNWRPLNVEEVRVFIAVQKDSNTIKKQTSNQNVVVNADINNLTEIRSINLTYLDLIAFYYTDKVLSNEQLQSLAETLASEN